MIILITGGSKCGKSSLAEKILDGFCGAKFYIAAMEPYSEDARRAIARHHEMRRGKGFETIERHRDIGGLVLPKSDIHACALLECMGTLCANEMFTDSGIADPFEKIINGVENLALQTEKLVIVTNEVGSDGINYPRETMEYMRVLGLLNRRVSELADTVIECVCGIPLVLKGELQ